MKVPHGTGVVELAALSALSAFACIVAAACADLLFVALFGAAESGHGGSVWTVNYCMAPVPALSSAPTRATHRAKKLQR